MLALGFFSTGLAYVWNTNVVAAWGATKASTVTYVVPVLSVALGVFILAERLSWNQPVGAVLVAAGFLISQKQVTRIISLWRPPPRGGFRSPPAALAEDCHVNTNAESRNIHPHWRRAVAVMVPIRRSN
jgi:hypothetical protein